MWSVAAVTGERDSLQGGETLSRKGDCLLRTKMCMISGGDRPWEECGLSQGILGGSLSLSSLDFGAGIQSTPHTGVTVDTV